MITKWDLIVKNGKITKWDLTFKNGKLTNNKIRILLLKMAN
jgi:hypothetical protein